MKGIVVLNIDESLEEFIETLTVLYVEDNIDAREAMSELLNMFFKKVIIAVNGEDGIAKFKENKIDIVISDIRMPKMDGVEMSKRIKELDKNIPIIIVTAHQESNYLLDCIKYAIDAYILKPVNATKLEETIFKVADKIYCDLAKEKYEIHLEDMVRMRTRELEKAHDQLVSMVNHDSMTGLYNRRYFNEITTTLMHITKRNENALSVLMIDIDNFKIINDKYGHLEGDKVIQEVAKLLMKITRQSDIVIRFGGEEFIVLLPNTDIEGASEIAKKIKNQINEITIYLSDTNKITFTVSIGVAACDCNHDMDIDELVHKADVAMYDAKLSGRNKVVMYRNLG